HKAQTLAECADWDTRTYIPEPRAKDYDWTDKPAAWRQATEANRRRMRGARSKRLKKKRSELVERSFAHVCETGGGRRTWRRGLGNVTKRYLVQVAAHNWGLLMRKLFGVGKPRALQGSGRWPIGMATTWYWLSGHWIGLKGSHSEPRCQAAAI